jgi:hypothetical protein
VTEQLSQPDSNAVGQNTTAVVLHVEAGKTEINAFHETETSVSNYANTVYAVPFLAAMISMKFSQFHQISCCT